ncbi:MULTISPECIES: iron ABC transporter permease [unclassified Paraburkholderia]|uniref:FecCD family ABC transporter permease n=1 Tax=unclassified Paraburkholderia TaxID=2615204 RepID=UPI002AB087D8|nr:MULTISPECIES: iron ABC transporter permease [unclassified Paraburkholderia]
MTRQTLRLARPTAAASPVARGPRSRAPLVFAGLGVLLAATVLAAVCMGAYPISPAALWQAFMSGDLHAGAQADRSALVLLELRLPRVAMALLVGAGFGAAGSALQALLRNPLADPGLIGVSSGAALGASLLIVFGAALLPHLGAFWPAVFAGGIAPGSSQLTAIAAFVGALGVTLGVYRIASSNGRVVLPILLLAGVAANALAGAVIGTLSYVASDAQLRSLTFWSLGSLADAKWSTLSAIAPFVIVGIVTMAAHTRALNAMQLGELEAHYLGVPVKRVKHSILLASALTVGALVSSTGQIGFIGLVAPHCVRLLCGPDQRVVLPGAMLLGALLTVAADLAARTLVAPAEIPLGVLTALLGAPFFIVLILRSRRHFGG